MGVTPVSSGHLLENIHFPPAWTYMSHPWTYISHPWACNRILGLIRPILGLICPILGLRCPILGLICPILGLIIASLTYNPILGLVYPILGLIVPSKYGVYAPVWLQRCKDAGYKTAGYRIDCKMQGCNLNLDCSMQDANVFLTARWPRSGAGGFGCPQTS